MKGMLNLIRLLLNISFTLILLKILKVDNLCEIANFTFIQQESFLMHCIRDIYRPRYSRPTRFTTKKYI